MAKVLKKQQPMSSVERFFAGASLQAALAAPEGEGSDGSAAETPPDSAESVTSGRPPAPVPLLPVIEPVPSAAVEVSQAEAPRRPHPQAARTAHDAIPITSGAMRRALEPIDRQREFQLTRSTDAILEDLVMLYRRATGSDVTRSHVLRSVLKAVAEQLPELREAAEGIGPLRRPSNARGFEEAREEFEEQIKEAFRRGMAAGAARRTA
jgi:hypothetical protein